MPSSTPQAHRPDGAPPDGAQQSLFVDRTYLARDRSELIAAAMLDTIHESS